MEVIKIGLSALGQALMTLLILTCWIVVMGTVWAGVLFGLAWFFGLGE